MKMRKFITAATLCLLLTGCGLVQQAQIKTVTAEVKKQQADECDKYRYGTKVKKSYYRYQKCKNDIAEAKIQPMLPPQFLATFLTAQSDYLSFSRSADKQKMDDADFEVGIEKIKAGVMRQAEQLDSEQRQINSQAWQNVGKALSDYGKTRYAPGVGQVQTTPYVPSVQTNCSTLGNTTNCTSQ